MGSEGDFNRDRAELFEALGHPTRIRILQALSGGPRGFSELKREAGVEGNGLMAFHLGKLGGLVRATPEGGYALTDEGKEALRSIVANAGLRNNGLARKISRKRATILAVALVLAIVASGVLAWNGYCATQLNLLDAAVENVRFDGARIMGVAVFKNATADRGSLEFTWAMRCNNPSEGRLFVEVIHFDAIMLLNGTSSIGISEGPVGYVGRGSVEPHSMSTITGVIALNTTLSRAIELEEFFMDNGTNMTQIIAYVSFTGDFQHVSVQQTFSTMEDGIYLYGEPHVIER